MAPWAPVHGAREHPARRGEAFNSDASACMIDNTCADAGSPDALPDAGSSDAHELGAGTLEAGHGYGMSDMPIPRDGKRGYALKGVPVRGKRRGYGLNDRPIPPKDIALGPLPLASRTPSLRGNHSGRYWASTWIPEGPLTPSLVPGTPPVPLDPACPCVKFEVVIVSSVGAVPLVENPRAHATGAATARATGTACAAVTSVAASLGAVTRRSHMSLPLAARTAPAPPVPAVALTRVALVKVNPAPDATTGTLAPPPPPPPHLHPRSLLLRRLRRPRAPCCHQRHPRLPLGPGHPLRRWSPPAGCQDPTHEAARRKSPTAISGGRGRTCPVPPFWPWLTHSSLVLPAPAPSAGSPASPCPSESVSPLPPVVTLPPGHV